MIFVCGNQKWYYLYTINHKQKLFFMTYIVVRQFVNGILNGITISTKSPVAFEVGKTYKGLLGTSDFVVLSCKPANQ